MVQIKVIRPYRIKGEASCERCSLSYSKRDYGILYKGEKLVYFDITTNDKTRLICHDCFYKYLRMKSREMHEEDFPIKVIDGNRKFVIRVTNKPEDESGFVL